MNNVVRADVVLDIANQKAAAKGSPFMDVDTPKKTKGPELYPIVDKKRVKPIKVWELEEMENKLRLYMGGTSGELFDLYTGVVRAINRMIELELEIARKNEGQKCK